MRWFYDSNSFYSLEAMIVDIKLNQNDLNHERDCQTILGPIFVLFWSDCAHFLKHNFCSKKYFLLNLFSCESSAPVDAENAQTFCLTPPELRDK